MPFTHRGDDGLTTAATSYNVTVPNLAAGGTLWVTIWSRGSTGAAPAPTLAMTGATFSLAASVGSLPSNSRVSLFTAQTYNAGASQTLTIDFAGNSQAALLWSVEEQSNPGGGSPVLRSGTIYNSTAATSHTVSLTPGAGEQFMAVVSFPNALLTPVAGATELMDRSSSTTASLETNWNPVVGNPTVTSGSVTSAVIAVAANVGSPGGFVHRAGDVDTANLSSYNKTIPYLAGGGVLWVSAYTTATSAPATPTLSMTGATFTLARSEIVSTHRFSVWYSQDYDSGTNQTIGFAGGSAFTGLLWTVEEQIPGHTAGSPVVQSNAAVSASSPVATTLAAGSGALFGFVAAGTGGAITANSGSELFERTMTSPTAAAMAYWSPTVNTAPSVTVASGSNFGLIALEVISAVAQARVAWAQMAVPDVPTLAEAHVAFAQMEVPNAAITPQARVAWAQMQVPSLALPGSIQVAYATLEVPDAPTPPAPWDPAAECETLEYRNPAGEVVRFRTLIGTVGRFMPPIGVTTIPVAAGHGSHYLGAAHIERPVVVPVAIPGPLDGRTELRRWAQVLDPSVGQGTLTVVEGTWAGRRLRCVYEAGLDEWAETNRRVNAGTLLFRAAWPYWEDSSEFTVSVDQDDVLHTWFPFLPLIFGPSDAFSLFTVDNTGDVDAWPVITVTGPAEDVTVTNLTTGALWHVGGALLPGSVLTVDHRPGQKTVRVDGVNAFERLAAGSSLWPLKRGVNQVDVAAGATDLDTLITFTWRRQWLAA